MGIEVIYLQVDGVVLVVHYLVGVDVVCLEVVGVP